MADGCDCVITYEPVQFWVRALASDGAEVPGLDWYKSDSIVDFDISPEIEKGAEKLLRCGGVIKNVMKEPDELKGATLKVTMCCQNAVMEDIINGSVGTVIFDASSPPCAIGYEEPTLAEQANARPFEVELWLKHVEGSSTVGYKMIHFFYALPTFLSEKGTQQDYTMPDFTISCTENANYGVGTPMPVRKWQVYSSIP